MKTHQRYWKNLQILNHKIIDFNTLKNKTEIDILDNLYDQGLNIETFKLNSKQYKEVEKFFATMPKLSHKIEVTNPNTKKTSPPSTNNANNN